MAKRDNRLRREEKTILAMIRIYCRGHHRHKKESLCPECQELLAYAERRLDKCPFGSDKPTCAQCAVHCYKADIRRQVRQVMQYAGPRMIWRHPYLAIMHLLNQWNTKKTQG
ncbi:MAG: nitrous oxide-stimulated promoter family protein [Sedimentisphaerales bacterium]|nr:nitrous oxide-stimulated promoter family protein [Sedimentisphaerales bacterium]